MAIPAPAPHFCVLTLSQRAECARHGARARPAIARNTRAHCRALQKYSNLPQGQGAETPKTTTYTHLWLVPYWVVQHKSRYDSVQCTVVCIYIV